MVGIGHPAISFLRQFEQNRLIFAFTLLIGFFYEKSGFNEINKMQSVQESPSEFESQSIDK